MTKETKPRTNNTLTTAELFRLANAIEDRTKTHSANRLASWAAAEELFSAELGRRVTRANILTAAGVVGVAIETIVGSTRGAGAGDLERRIEAIENRLNELSGTAAIHESFLNRLFATEPETVG